MIDASSTGCGIVEKKIVTSRKKNVKKKIPRREFCAVRSPLGAQSLHSGAGAPKGDGTDFAGVRHN